MAELEIPKWEQQFGVLTLRRGVRQRGDKDAVSSGRTLTEKSPQMGIDVSFERLRLGCVITPTDEKGNALDEDDSVLSYGMSDMGDANYLRVATMSDESFSEGIAV